MPLIRSICVFCGSGPGTDPRFAESAAELGLAIAQAGIQLVYGGGSGGLMGIVARAVRDNGGHVIGIIPDFLRSKEMMLEGAREMIVTTNMHERKMLMFDRADAFVALPGGIGTLEELVEQLTWSQLGQHNKPIIIADIGGFWRPLMSLLAHMRETAFIRDGLEVRYQIAERTEEILPMLNETMRRRAAVGR
ncbi:COG1611 Predicted Rossmann fold nucleotide-binding protein [Rhabdaerophilaceae bacterium]